MWKCVCEGGGAYIYEIETIEEVGQLEATFYFGEGSDFDAKYVPIIHATGCEIITWRHRYFSFRVECQGAQFTLFLMGLNQNTFITPNQPPTTHTHTHTHTHNTHTQHTYTLTYTDRHTHIHRDTRTHTYTHTNTQRHTHTHIHTHTHTHTHTIKWLLPKGYGPWRVAKIRLK